jgi:hypothetical protein
MFIVTKKQIRPNTSVQFVSSSTFPEIEDEFKRHMYVGYTRTGKFINATESTSSDGLTKTTVTTWLSEVDFNAWKADPVCTNFIERYNQYCTANGISVVNETSQSS